MRGCPFPLLTSQPHLPHLLHRARLRDGLPVSDFAELHLAIHLAHKHLCPATSRHARSPCSRDTAPRTSPTTSATIHLDRPYEPRRLQHRPPDGDRLDASLRSLSFLHARGPHDIGGTSGAKALSSASPRKISGYAVTRHAEHAREGDVVLRQGSLQDNPDCRMQDGGVVHGGACRHLRRCGAERAG